MKEFKRNNIFFFMLKSVLKCIESIRIKKWVKIFQNLEGGGGVRPSWSKANFLNFF